MGKFTSWFSRSQRQLQTSIPENKQPEQIHAESISESIPFPVGIEVWHDCQNAAFDICFIHGLTGDRRKTWTANGQDLPWPKMLLPKDFGKARIFTYGYDADILRESKL